MQKLLIDNVRDLIDYFEDFDNSYFVFDTETTGLRIKELEIMGLSVYNGQKDPAFIQFNFETDYVVKVKSPLGGNRKVDEVRHYSHTTGIDMKDALPVLKRVFTGAKIGGHNIKFDYKVANKYGFSDFEIVEDSMIMTYLINVNEPNGLKYNVHRWLGYKMTEFTDVVGEDRKYINYSTIDYEKMADYGADDSYWTYKLIQKLTPELEKLELVNTYRKIELPIIKDVANMEIAGVRIDTEVLADMSINIHKAIKEAEEAIYNKVGVEFNIGSGKQLAEILFDRLKYPVIAETKKGARSVDEKVMNELAYRGYEIAEDIITYKELTKLASTYIDAIPEMLDDDGRLRGNFNQIGARTGRFSSSNPNLQNQPNDDRFPVRLSFIPERGKEFLVFDWSMIEIRVMAHESNDPTFISLLNNYADVHQATADKINSLTGLSISRSDGKTLNFAILYGMGAEALMYKLNKALKQKVVAGKMTQAEYKKSELTLAKAKSIINGFYTVYHGYTAWGKKIAARSRAQGYVRTLGGRIRPLLRGDADNMIVNTMIQGGAADLMKRGIYLLCRKFEEKYPGTKLLMVVHDEFIVEADKNIAKECLKDCIDIVQNIFPACRVPILCEGGRFNNWAGMKNKKLRGGKENLVLDMYFNKYGLFKN